MDILIVSDTHGRRDRLAEVLRRSGAGVLLFLGDGLRDLEIVPDTVTVRAVRGNCDFIGKDVPETRLENFGTCRAFMSHGHRFGVKGDLTAAVCAAVESDADLLLYGHTHVPFERMLPTGLEIGGCTLQKPLRLFCPGSLGDPRNGVPTFGTLTIRNGVMLTAHGHL